jgi:hypothetical protein
MLERPSEVAKGGCVKVKMSEISSVGMRWTGERAASCFRVRELGLGFRSLSASFKRPIGASTRDFGVQSRRKITLDAAAIIGL